jgi:hypothetical protein
MSFLDSLENNLKALESREEKDPEKLRREHEQREADRAAALLRAPHAEALKKSPFTSELLTQCRVIGHGMRVLVQFTWIGETLRLDAKAKRLELVPTADGIEAQYSVDGVRTASELITLTGGAEEFARRWLTQE